MKLKGNDKLLIGCIYRSEGGMSENNRSLNNLLKEATQKRYTHLLIMGDFNYKDIKWNQNWSTPGLSESSEEFLFVENLRDCYLYQHIIKPTRTRQGQELSILDLLLSHEEGMIRDIEYLSPLGKSDLLVISFNLICYIQQIKSKRNLLPWERKLHKHERGVRTNKLE